MFFNLKILGFYFYFFSGGSTNTVSFNALEILFSDSFFYLFVKHTSFIFWKYLAKDSLFDAFTIGLEYLKNFWLTSCRNFSLSFVNSFNGCFPGFLTLWNDYGLRLGLFYAGLGFIYAVFFFYSSSFAFLFCYSLNLSRFLWIAWKVYFLRFFLDLSSNKGQILKNFFKELIILIFLDTLDVKINLLHTPWTFLTN